VPPTLTHDALEEKQAAAMGAINCDVAFWGGFVGPVENLRPLVEAGVCGFKSFLVDSGVEEFPPVTLGQLGAAMEIMAGLGVPALVHAEDPSRIGVVPAGADSYRVYMETRPVDSESEAVREVSALASRTGASAHVLHLSSGEAADEIGAGPENLTAETCPHYLVFAADEIADGETMFKCCPPIRDAEHREALWEALDNGWLAMVVSDHSPAPPSLKAGDFSQAWGGISSLQLRLPATWTGADARGHEMARLTEWLATAPARLAGLDDRKGVIGPGWDADLVAWDPDGVTAVRGSALHHRHALTPYEGMDLRGRVVATVLGGELVFSDDVVVGGRGRILLR
jgi:allantoinase